MVKRNNPAAELAAARAEVRYYNMLKREGWPADVIRARMKSHDAARKLFVTLDLPKIRAPKPKVKRKKETP